MWGGTPNRPAMGPEHLVAGPGRWGSGRPRRTGGTGPPRRARPRRRRRRAARPGPGRRPHADLHGARRGRRGGRAGRRARDRRPAPEPLEHRHDGPPMSPIPRSESRWWIRPTLHPMGGYHAASVDPAGSGAFRGVDPHASGGFRGAEPQASGRFREVEPYASSGFRWPVVAPSASGGRRAVSADLHTWGGEPRTHAAAGGASGELPRTHGRRRVGRSVRPGLVRPARGPTVADGDDGRVVPGGLLDAAQQVTDTGRHHRRLAPAGW